MGAICRSGFDVVFGLEAGLDSGVAFGLEAGFNSSLGTVFGFGVDCESGLFANLGVGFRIDFGNFRGVASGVSRDVDLNAGSAALWGTESERRTGGGGGVSMRLGSG